MRTDEELVERVRAGDEEAFAELVMRYHRLMRRVARGYVRTDAIADEVVQESWIAVLRGIDRFEGRSSLKTWLFRILLNRAHSAATKEQRAGSSSSTRTSATGELPTLRTTSSYVSGWPTLTDSGATASIVSAGADFAGNGGPAGMRDGGARCSAACGFAGTAAGAAAGGSTVGVALK